MDMNEIIDENKIDIFVGNVNKCLLYLGMSKSDFTNRLNWSPSKYSKSFGVNKGRTITLVDASEVADILGFGIDDLMAADFEPANTRPSKKRMSLKNTKRLSHCLDDAITFRTQWQRLEKTFHDDYPKAIRAALNLFSEEYSIEGHMNWIRTTRMRPSDEREPSEKNYKPYVFVKYNGLNSEMNDDLIFGYWFDKDNQFMSLSICYMPDKSKFSDYGVRKRKYYKDLVGRQDGEMKEDNLDSYARNLAAGEIYSKVYEFRKSNLSDDALTNDLKTFFEIYKELIIKASKSVNEAFWDAYNNVTSKPENNSVDVMEDVVTSIEHTFLKRRKLPILKKEVLESSGYQCEICGRKETFEDKNGKQFFEVSRLIPLSQCHSDWNPDAISNLICVCPQCNRLLAYANNNLKEMKLVELYYKRKDALKNDGIDISLSELLKMNGL